MDYRKLKRDRQVAIDNLKALPDGSMLTKKACKIYIPYRYVEYGLAKIGIENHILGVYALVYDDSVYSISLINAMVPINPSQTNRIKVDGEDYLEFVFEANSVVIKNMDLVKTDTIVYLIFEEFYLKGHVPWFIGYKDYGLLLDTAAKHAGTNIAKQREVIQAIASICARSADDRSVFYRSVIKSEEDLVKNPPVFIPLRSVRWAATNTLTKIGGSYFSVGVTSALLSPAERPERIETILRK
jgi:hypothetical protein